MVILCKHNFSNTGIMKIETRNNGLFDYKVIIADEGKVLKRISDGHQFGKEVILGKTWYIFDEDGKTVKLEAPIQEEPEHYMEIDEPAVEPEGMEQ